MCAVNFSQIRPFVRYARYMTLSKNESYIPMIACDARLFYALDGEGKICVGGEEYRMEKGCILIINSGVEYWIKSPENHISYIALNFDYTFEHSDMKIPVPPQRVSDFSPDGIVEKVMFEDIPELSEVLFVSEMYGVSARLAAIEREYSMNVIFHETKISSMLCDLLCDVVRRLRSDTVLGGGGKLDSILGYVHEHFREPLTNEQLGELFGFHKNYISGMIKEYTGMPLHKYLNHVRVSHAVDMLNDGEDSVTEIARACGFCDIYYFSRYFKQFVGVSPTEYRKSRV